MPQARYPALIRDLLDQGWTIQHSTVVRRPRPPRRRRKWQLATDHPATPGLIVETRRGRMVDHATYSSSESLVLAATPTAVRALARQQPKSDTEAVRIADVQLLGQLTVAPGLAAEQ